MSGTTTTERFVFDAYASRPVVLFSLYELTAHVVVVTDDAITNTIDGSSMPQAGDDFVTVAGPATVMRGKCIQLAYIVRLDATGDANSQSRPE